MGLLRAGYEEHGPVFSIRLGPRPAAVLIGAEQSRFFFRETDHSLSLAEAHRWLVPMFGERFPLSASVDDHRRYRAVYAAPFRPDRLPGHVEVMESEAQAWLDRLGDAGELELVSELERLQLRIAIGAVLGDRVAQRLGGSAHGLFADLGARSTHHLIRNHRVPDPRGRRAKRRLAAAVGEELSDPHGRPGAFLEDFARAADAEGEPVPAETAVDLALGMVWASYPTSTGQLAWALALLLAHPDELEPVVAEADSVLAGDARPDASAVDRLRVLDRALREAERMRPAVMLLGRHVASEFELGTYMVPAGWAALISPAVTHRLPELFEEPDRYDPGRFARPADAGPRPERELIGFGGGLHVCPGKRFAYTAMKVITSRLLSRYTLEPLGPFPKGSAGPSPSRPRAPVPVRYRRR